MNLKQEQDALKEALGADITIPEGGSGVALAPNVGSGLAGWRWSDDLYGGLIFYKATDTYNSVDGTGTYQFRLGNDGKIYAANGKVVIDENAINIAPYTGSPWVLTLPNAVSFGATGEIGGWSSSSVIHGVQLQTNSVANEDSSLVLSVNAPTGRSADMILESVSGAQRLAFEINNLDTGVTTFALAGAPLDMGSQKITSLANGTAVTDAATVGQAGIAFCTFAAANGNNNDISITGFVDGGTNYVRITGPTGAFAITGITAPTKCTIVILQNTTTQAMTVSNAAGTSQSANQINTSTGADLVSTGRGACAVVYDTTAARWLDFSFQA